MWLQTHLEIIEASLLVSLGCCDFFEFPPSHGDLLAADGCQPFDDVTHGPLSIFVSTVGGEEGRQSLFHMPLQVIGKRAQEHVTLNPIIGLVINRSHFELHGFEIAKGLFDKAQLFVGGDHFSGSHLLLGHLSTDNVTAVKEFFGSDLVLVKTPGEPSIDDIDGVRIWLSWNAPVPGPRVLRASVRLRGAVSRRFCRALLVCAPEAARAWLFHARQSWGCDTGSSDAWALRDQRPRRSVSHQKAPPR